jgi:glucose/arabinose dehydrogenase
MLRARNYIRFVLLSAACAALLETGCTGASRMPDSNGIGPSPTLPPPDGSLIPLVNVVTARGWAPGQTPVAADGAIVTALATNLDHPRWVYVLPNGDVLVAETNAPKRPKNNPGLKGRFFNHYQKKAGGGVPSANRITLLRDADGDGKAEVRTVLLRDLNSPFGMALVGESLYVANSDALVRFPYHEGDTEIHAAPVKVADLPAGDINHHWTKNVIASADGSKLYVAVGSNSNAGEYGLEAEQERACIWEIDAATGAHRVFASGLRNPVGMAWVQETGALWAAVNERDELGNDLVPDYMTAVKDGAFYGWPYSYYGANIDKRVNPQRPDLVAKAIKPDYALGSHVAALGLAAPDGNALPKTFAKGMFIGQHGSWNRKPRSGYNVVFVPFDGGKPSGKPIEVLTGFVSADGKAYGRPVGVAIDKRGALLVADDVGNAVWRVTGAR